MKRTKTLGYVALGLAVVTLLLGVCSVMLRGNGGPFASLTAASAKTQQAAQQAQADVKNAESVEKKAKAAVSSAQKAIVDAQAAEAAVQDVAQTMQAGADVSDASTSALYVQVESARDSATAVAGTVQSPGSAGDAAQQTVTLLDEAARTAQALALAPAREAYDEARESLDKAEQSRADALASLNVLLLAQGAAEMEQADTSIAVEPQDSQLANLQTAADVLSLQAQLLHTQAEAIHAGSVQLLETAKAAQGQIAPSRADKLVELLKTYYIAIWFTGLLLLLVAVICLFFGEAFLRAWKKNPVFSTFIALLVMLILQTYSMKFTYSSFGEWAKFWFDNAFNVLRANTSVGIIALGMTLVIITGGIDLAVGSTLAGVGTVLMVLIDTSSNGVLVRLGITGVPAYILGIAGGCLTGALIGALIGLGVTKGRVPPFIITLGVMNIVRSLAQYFTKSYIPKVPTEFQAISNTVIFGQRLLPIVYWLLIAVMLSVVMKRTSFGRYVYAVGSNERTTRLSGINVDKVKFKVYTLMGFLVSIAAVTQVSRLGGMDVASSGSGYELDAIAAVVVGGTSMSGGRGSIVGTVIGVLIIGVMNNLLILLGVDSFLTNAFKGAIVIAAVLMQRKENQG